MPTAPILTMPGEIPTQPATNGHAADGGLKLGDFSIDEHRPIKVVCIGAGFSGIIAGIRRTRTVESL